MCVSALRVAEEQTVEMCSSRLLCSILVFKVATRTDLMYTMHLYLLSLFMIRRLPYEVCELKYILLLLNVYVE